METSPAEVLWRFVLIDGGNGLNDEPERTFLWELNRSSETKSESLFGTPVPASLDAAFETTSLDFVREESGMESAKAEKDGF
jgi:hypothetical protein